MKSFSIVLVACLHISVISFGLCYVKASAQLADTMECADESCSETISEGEARLAYRPRDDKFLNLKKGDVVLVKSKNAGKKSHLWGGQVMGNYRFGFFPSSFIKEYMVLVKSPKVTVGIQDFLEGRNPTKTEDVYSGLVGENQKITIDKTKKTKTEGKDKKKQETGLDEKARKEEQKLHDRKNDGEKGTSKDVSMEDNDKEHPTSGQRPKEVEPATPGDGGRSQQEPEQVRLKRNIEEHPDDGDATSNVVTPDSDFENAGRPKEENRNRESNGVEDTTDKQLKESEDGANDQSREEDGTMEEHQISSDLKDSGNIEGRHLDTTESNMEKDASKQIPRNEQEKSSDVKKQEAAKIPPDIAVLVGEDGVVGTELENEEIHPSKDSAKKGKSVARSDQQHENPKASDEEGHSKQLDQKDVEVNQDALNEKDQDTEVNKKSEDNDTRRENLTKGEKESRVENTKAGTVPPPVDVDSSKSVDDGPFEDDVDFEEGYYDNDKGEVEEETLPETGDFPHGSSKTDEKIYNSPTGQDSDDDAAELENASGPEEGDNQGKEHRGSIQQSPEADVQESDSNIKQNSTSTQENVETNRRESDPHEGDLQKEPASHRRPLEAVEEEKNGIKIGNSPDDEGKNQGEDGKHHDVQRKSDQSKTGRGDEVGDEHNSAHKDNEQNGEVGNDHDSAHGVDKGKTQFDEEPEHQAEERKTHPDASENNLDSDRKLVEEKMQSDKDNQYHADESKTRAKEENEKTQFDEESEHQAEQRKIHLDESGDDLDSAHKSVEEKVQSDKDNQHQDDENKARAKEPSIHHDEVGNDRDSALGKDKEKMEFDEESENQVKERKTHPDSSHNSEEKQVLHEQAAVISGANEHEVQARNTNSKPQASVESKVESNEEQQNAVPNKKEENSRSNETDGEHDVGGMANYGDDETKGTSLSTDVQMEHESIHVTAGVVVESEEIKDDVAPSSDDEASKIGLTELQEDALLKWFIPKPWCRAVVEPSSLIMESDGLAALPSENGQCLAVLNDPLLLRTLMPRYHSPMSSRDTSKQSDYGLLPGFTDMMQHSLLRWYLSGGCLSRHCHCQMRTKKMESSYLDNPLLKWIISNARCKPLLAKRQENHPKLDDRSTSRYVDDPFLRCIILNAKCKSPLAKYVKFHENLGDWWDETRMPSKSSYTDDPLLKWIVLNGKCKAKDLEIVNREPTGQESIENVTPSHCQMSMKKKESSYLDDPLLKWMILNARCKPLPAKCKENNPKLDDRLNRIGMPSTSRYVDDPLLRCIILNAKCKSTLSKYVKFHENIGDWWDGNRMPSKSSYTDDPLLKWIVFNGKCKAKDLDIVNGEPTGQESIENMTPSHCQMRMKKKESSYLDDPLLKWMILNARCKPLLAKCKENHPKLDDRLNRIGMPTTSRYVDDPLLRCIILNAKCKSTLSKYVKFHKNIGDWWDGNRMPSKSSYTDDPLLKWIVLNRKCKAKDLKTENGEPDCQESIENAMCSYKNHPLLKWMWPRRGLCPLARRKVNADSKSPKTLADSKSLFPVVENLIGNVEESRDICDTYYRDPLMKWILPGNAKCVERLKNPIFMADMTDAHKPIALAVDEVGQTETIDLPPQQSSVADDPNLKWLPASLAKCQIVDDEEAVVEDSSEDQYIATNAWMSLRKLLTAFQNNYENSAAFRVGVVDINRDLQIFIKTDKKSARPFHQRLKSFRKDVINLENDILTSIQEISARYYSTGMSKEDQSTTERDVIPKFESLLENVERKVEEVQNEMNALHEELHAKIYRRSEEEEEEEDEVNYDVPTESDTNEEMERLQKKLAELDEKLAAKDTESSELVEKMKLEAELFSSRIGELEESIQKRQEDDKILTAHSEETQRKLAEQLATLESALSEKKDEKIEAAREEARVIKEKLKELEASLKLNVETDKPFIDRITTLEEELTSRKDQELEKTKQEKSEAILLRSKIHALERQLKKRHFHGGSTMLREAKVLKEKVKTLEENLAMKAEVNKQQSLPDNKDTQLHERIASLESELWDRLETASSEQRTQEALDLKERVLAMEARLKKEFETTGNLKTETIAVHPENITEKTFSKKKASKGQNNKVLTQDEILELLNTFFFQQREETQNSPAQYRNESDAFQHELIGKLVENNNSDPDLMLQMEAANLKETAAVENEQVIKPESDYEKYNALHEGEVVDWDEEIDGKAKKEKSVGWDETLGGDHVGDSHFVPSSTEKTLEEEGGEKEGRKENVLSESPIEDDVIEHSTVTPQPLDVEQITPTTPGHDKSHPSETRAKSDTATDEEPNEQGEPKSLEDEPPQQQQEKIERGNDTEVGESEESMAKVPEVEDNIDRELPTTEEMHVESFWLRLLLVLSNLPFDIIYILEPFFNTWVSLLPKEYHNDVHGVSWTIVLSTFFIGFGLIWFLTYRSISLKRVQKNERILHNIQELKTQLENLSQEKVQVENELRTKENEVEIQGELMATASEEKDEVVNERRGLEHSLQEFNTENEALKRDLQQLNHTVHEKDKTMQEILANSKQVEKSLLAQHEAIVRYEAEIGQLQESLKNHDTSVKEAEASADKLKERIKNLEKSKGEAKKEGKVIREQTEKLNTTINELQERLDAKMAEGEQQGQEIDVLKDCILQFKGAQDYLTDEGEDAESDDTIEKQKNKMKSMIDVANAKNILRQTEADKLQITYELEAERKSRFDIEAKISELEALIQSDQAFKNKLERDKQMLESKLSVMQDFYAKREVEIQSKLGLEQSKRENNASMLEDRQKQHMEILQQLDAYKKMGEEAKQQYDDAERQHKQEILGFEKKAHDNWLACRDAERKVEEAHKQITQLHLELGDVRQRLRDSEREPILRPRPERHGPPGAPPPFGPPRRPPPPGMLGPPPPRMMGSPLHFRNGPEADRRSPPPHHRRPPSPSGSIPGSRPDRPPSTQSLPSMDRRLRPGPPLGPGRPYSPGRSYGDGIPPTRPPPRDLPAHARPPPGARMQSGPMTSSPYMERPPMPRSQSPGPRFQNFTQSSLHATPPHGTGEGLRNDGYQPPPPPESTGPPPPNTSRDRDTNSSNPFRRSRP